MPADLSSSFEGGRYSAYDSVGSVFYISSGNQILRWDAATGVFQTPLTFDRAVHGLGVTPDGRYLLVGQAGTVSTPTGIAASVVRINIATGATETLLLPVTFASEEIEDFEVGVGGHVMVLINRWLATFSGSSPSPELSNYLLQGESELNVSPNHRYILALGVTTSNGPFVLYDSLMRTSLSSDLSGQNLSGFNGDRGDVTDAGYVAIATYDSLLVYNSSLRVVRDLSAVTAGAGAIADVQFNRDGRLLLLWNPATSRIEIYSTQTWAKVGAFDAGLDIEPIWVGATHGTMDLIANDRFLVLVGGDGQSRIIDLAARGMEGGLTFEGSTAADYLVGWATDDTLKGLGGDDVLAGSSGRDTFDGGSGSDTVDYSTVAAGIVVRLDLGETTDDGQGGRDLLVSIENVTGSAFNDRLTGDANANALNGGVGADVMAGGGGNDAYEVDNVGDVIVEAANSGTDSVRSSVSYRLAAGVENLELTGYDNLNATGNDLANVLIGNMGNNILDGGKGADTMRGSRGLDTYYVDDVGDRVLEEANGGYDIVYSSASFSFADQSIEQLILTGNGDLNVLGDSAGNRITGTSGANMLDGGAGNDALDGRGGDDLLKGGAGNDTFYVDSQGDVVVEAANGGYDELLSTTSYTLQAGVHVERLYLTGLGSLNLTGNELANSLAGNGGNNVLDGGGGADQMTGGAGNDTFHVDNVKDAVSEYSGQGSDTVIASVSYTLGSSAYVEFLVLSGTANTNGTGNNIANTITGNTGNNILDGGGGADTMIGGKGDDTYYVQSTGDTVIETKDQGTDLVYSSVNFTLGASSYVERLTLTGSADIKGTGNNLDNILTGNAGNNVLTGGKGHDTYYVQNTGDTVVEAKDQGTDLVYSTASFTLGASSYVENLTLTGSAAINGKGNNLANVITGNAGDNILDGGKGDDTLAGGAGDDTYYVDSAGDVVTEKAGEGTDLIVASASFVIGGASYVENLTLTGSANLNGTGNNLANVITGNAGNNLLDGGKGDDTLIGGAGIDTLRGGAGDDTYHIDSLEDLIVEASGGGQDRILASISYTLIAGSYVENLTLAGSADINGTGDDLANVITGNAGNNVLSGGGGADTLIGGGGSDTLKGGAGDDTYVIVSGSEVITEKAGEGTDLIVASVSFTMTSGSGVENLTLTGSENINGKGDDLANVITGNAGANILNGGKGADTLIGGAGDDTYYIDSASDVVRENSGEGTDLVIASFSFALTAGSYVENLTLSGTGDLNGAGNDLDNVIRGNPGKNILDGGLGNDTLNGGGGADTLRGGVGDDVYYVDHPGDRVFEARDEGHDRIHAAVSYVMVGGVYVEDLTLTGDGNIDGTGNSLANVIKGNSGNNILDGGKGADTLIGGVGNDTYYLDNTGDVVVEKAGEGTDLVVAAFSFVLKSSSHLENLILTGGGNLNGAGNELDNVITGNTGINVLKGGAGDDTLDGGAGADRLEGGDGGDIYHVDDSGDVVVEKAGQGTDLIIASVSQVLAADSHIENLTLTGSADLNGSGNGLDNIITGNSGANVLDGGLGNDTLNGGDGADTLRGGAGDDIYYVDNIGDVVAEADGDGLDRVFASVSYTLVRGVYVENLTLTGWDDINGTGNGLDNIITGNQGDNVLNGGNGTDTLIGHHGDDTFYVDSARDVVIEYSNEGTDLIVSSVSLTLKADSYVENLTLAGSADLNGTGNGLDNLITGNKGVNVLKGGAGNDTLIGGAGADTLEGGAGDDTYHVDSTGDVVIEGAGDSRDTVVSTISYSLAGRDIEVLVLTGSANIDGVGNDVDNFLTGNAGTNVLEGRGGNDVLVGGAGSDTLKGGAGNDTYYVDDAGDVIVEARNEGEDRVYASISYTLSSGAYVEDLILTGLDDIDGTGNGLANVITGNEGNNVLDGGKGADTLIGGWGDDTYYVDSAADVVIEQAWQGTDLIVAAFSYVLTSGSHVENLALSGSANINGTGDELSNVITGNDGANVLKGGGGDDFLDGGAGADVLEGGAGDDTYYVDNSGDVVREGAGDSLDIVGASISYTLTGGNIEALVLLGTSNINGTGDAADNILVGNSGANTLNGGAGADILSGGGGSDTLTGGAGADVFVFSANSESTNGSPDRITDLSDEDFIDLTYVVRNSLYLVEAFSGQGDEIILSYDKKTDTTSLSLDINGDKVSDMTIRITGDHEDFDGFIFGGG